METLKYFSPQNLADFNQDNPRKIAKEWKQQLKVERAYHRALDRLEGRISKQAWNFFRFGFRRYGLHDARLLRLCVGDGLRYIANGKTPFYLNRNRAVARFEFISYYQEFLCIFECRGLTGTWCNLPVDEWLSSQPIGDLSTYELTAKGPKKLRLGFVFATGATIVVEFRKLVFRRKRLPRKYDAGEMYR